MRRTASSACDGARGNRGRGAYLSTGWNELCTNVSSKSNAKHFRLGTGGGGISGIRCGGARTILPGGRCGWVHGRG